MTTLTANDRLTLSKVWADIEAMHQEIEDIYMGQYAHYSAGQSREAAHRTRILARVMEALRMAADEIIELKDEHNAQA